MNGKLKFEGWRKIAVLAGSVVIAVILSLMGALTPELQQTILALAGMYMGGNALEWVGRGLGAGKDIGAIIKEIAKTREGQPDGGGS